MAVDPHLFRGDHSARKYTSFSCSVNREHEVVTETEQDKIEAQMKWLGYRSGTARAIL